MRLKRGGRLAPRLGVCLAVGVVGCLELPPPLARDAPTGGGDASGGAGSEGGRGGEANVLPVCGPEVEGACTKLVDVEAGATFTCGTFDDETLRCFGYNASYQLGDPSLTASAYASGVVAGVAAPELVALGQRHGCALVAKTLWCWGENNLGQLGTGDQVFGVAPRLILEGVDDVSTSARTTCVRRGGALSCWGILLDGQPWLGEDIGAYSTVATPVAGIAAATELAVGSMFACAAEGDAVRCWGRGALGQLGHGLVEDSALPVTVADTLATPLKTLTAGGEHACSLGGAPPRVQCWGRLPVIGANNAVPTDLPVQPDGEVVALGSGWRHSCALLADGRVQCWGLNLHGELGHGGDASDVPVTVVGLSDVVDLAVGFQHNCALRATGDLACWGRNHFHQLGPGSDAATEGTPVPVIWP